MRKMNWLVGALALGLGIVVGTLGVSLVTDSGSPASFISKLRGQDKIQTVAGTVHDTGATNSDGNTTSDGLAANSTASGTLGGTPEQDYTLSLANNGEGLEPSGGLNGQTTTNANAKVDPQLAQQIITDYKQDIGIFFGAWKSTDMATFRTKLAKAYTGALFEKHARRAEEYLVQGLGLDVSQITFDRVDVESAGTNTATLRADYRYTARDYDLTGGAAVGDEHEQTVHVRVNMIKLNSKWMITGESTI